MHFGKPSPKEFFDFHKRLSEMQLLSAEKKFSKYIFVFQKEISRISLHLKWLLKSSFQHYLLKFDFQKIVTVSNVNIKPTTHPHRLSLTLKQPKVITTTLSRKLPPPTTTAATEVHSAHHQPQWTSSFI